MRIPDKLESERLILKPVSKKWAKTAFKEFTAEITEYMTPPPAVKVEDTLAFLDKAIKENKARTDFIVYIFEKKTGEFIGGGGIHHLNQKAPVFGIWIKKGAHGHKYGLEAVTCLYNWASKNLAYDHFIYPVDKRNLASRKIPEFLGGRIFKEEEEVNQSGKTLNIVYYKIPKK